MEIKLFCLRYSNVLLCLLISFATVSNINGDSEDFSDPYLQSIVGTKITVRPGYV